MKNYKELVSSSSVRTLMLLRTAIYSGEIQTVKTPVWKDELSVCNELQEVIEDIMRLESAYYEMRLRYQHEEEENERYSELLHGLAPDELTEEQEEAIHRMTKTWGE